MNTPFNSPHGLLPGPTPFGFGSAAGHGRRGRHQLHREMREHLRDNHGGGFGREFPGFGPDFGFGPGGREPRGGHRGHRGHRGRRGPGRRGDVRAAILTLLAEQPVHGDEMIQEIAARSDGLWKPSPGSVYPTLRLLEDEGLIVAAEAHGKKKLFELTEEGRAAAGQIETPPWTEITEGADPGEVNLRDALGQLFGAAGQATHAANDDQQQRILDVINNARREIYQILGES